MRHYQIVDRTDCQRIAQAPYEDFMAHASVPDALADVAARHGERRALTFIEAPDPGRPPRTWTHAQFRAETVRAANLFAELSPGREARIAMLMPSIPQAWFTLFGGERAGVVCPINFLLDTAHVAELVRACEANILVALGPHEPLDIASRIAGVRDACPALRHVLVVGGSASGDDDFDRRLAAMPGDRYLHPRAIGRGTDAALFHTGGTTGAPKLARHTHGNQLHAAWGAAQMYAMTERDVVLNGFPLFHVAGSFVYGLSTLLAGGEVVLPTALGMRNPGFVARYWSFVERHGVTLLAGVPTVMAALLGIEPDRPPAPTVRALLTGGSPLPTEIAEGFEVRFGVPVRNILGMTECAGIISVEPYRAPRTPGSCGLPLPFTEVQAIARKPDDTRVRAGAARVCAPGEPGVLRVRGPNVGPGYTDRSRNAGTFTDDGWLVTGDIGHLDAQGRVFVTGRAKDLIIRSSHNIDPGLIEEALLAHPQVQLAAAVGEPDEYAGEIPAAFVVLKAGATASAEDISRFVEERIAERPAFPKRIEILDSMPLTAIGKVYKPALRLRAIERAIAERVERVGLADAVRVRAIEEGSGACVVFSIASAGIPREDYTSGIRALMAPFALDYRIEIEPATRTEREPATPREGTSSTMRDEGASSARPESAGGPR